MADHNEYLAIHVLNESQTISYRQVSRALKLHSSIAKQCLFDFHSRQNRKHPASVHATYLLTGLRHPPSSQATHDGDNDVPMSSPYQSSQPSMSQNDTQSSTSPALPTRVVLISSEADLEKAKATLDEVTSIHIYSLSASPTRDLQTLTECNRRLNVDHYNEDPLEHWHKYGVIKNDRVWRRTRKGAPVPPPEPPAPVKAAQPKAEEKAATAPISAPSSQNSVKSKPDAPEKKPPPLKKESSSLFKSFAKSKPPKPKEKEKEEDSTPALSDEEADDADLMDLDEGSLDNKDSQQSNVDPGKSKKEREEELRKMMDEDDEMADADGAGKAEVEKEYEHPTEAEQPQEPEKEEVQVHNGRRRGRRRVMKKRTVKDEEGYLVTKEEAAWESFSEDEAPAPKKAKPSIMAQAAAKSTGDKGGKKGGKGQNSIMSFFAKK
ncbi:DNA polymerase subunit Cdc27 [Elsinoe ampelina]|uniref:DNA polymerase delta subunit 3 n=1 Tax=Elsinoe ampelina TaxID=302913 RepID=A0A6A6GMQ1_9PEZI|nr:DNA polymerase subunit Cdc27 [Elsinoe ampelina]